MHRHPTQVCEAGLDLLLVGVLFLLRGRTGQPGQLFRAYLIGHAIIRFSLEPLRGDPARWLGPLTLVQVVCLATAVGFGTWMILSARASSPSSPPR